MIDGKLHLIAQIAGQRVAIAAGPVESVIELGHVQPVPRASRHVAGLAALRSRVLTVIDSMAALGLEGAVAAERPQAIVVTVDGHLYGLMVDRVEDVVALDQPAEPLRARLSGGWGRATEETVQIDGRTLLVIRPEALVAGPGAEAAGG